MQCSPPGILYSKILPLTVTTFVLHYSSLVPSDVFYDSLSAFNTSLSISLLLLIIYYTLHYPIVFTTSCTNRSAASISGEHAHLQYIVPYLSISSSVKVGPALGRSDTPSHGGTATSHPHYISRVQTIVYGPSSQNSTLIVHPVISPYS